MGQYSKQLLKDTTTEFTIKFTGIVDGGGPTLDGPNTTLIVSYLRGAIDTGGALRSTNVGGTVLPFYGVNVESIQYSFSSTVANSSITLNWRGATSNSVLAFLPTGQQAFELKEGLGVITWDAVGEGANSGELFIGANGVVSGAYTIIIHGRKNPAHFDRGYLVDPGSFRKP
jgi:hypothetical protein